MKRRFRVLLLLVVLVFCLSATSLLPPPAHSPKPTSTRLVGDDDRETESQTVSPSESHPQPVTAVSVFHDLEKRYVDSWAAFEAQIQLRVGELVRQRSVRSQQCNQSIVRREYTHRRPRRHEFSTSGLFDVLRSEADAFVALDTMAVPPVVNNEPLVLSGLNLSKPFGDWRASFFPVADAQRHCRAPQCIEGQPPPFVGLFQNAVAWRGQTVTCGGRSYTAGGCLWEFSSPPPGVWHGNRDDDVAIPFCDSWCKGYYHFTHEHLPRLALVHRLLLERAAKLVLPQPPTQFQRQFFDILGIPQTQLVVGHAVKAKVSVHVMPMRCGNSFTSALLALRRLVASVTEPASKAIIRPFRVLFAERRNGSRMPSNYAALKAAVMNSFGANCSFRSTGGQGSVRDQIGLFRWADVIVGPHGANLANIMFAREHVHVIEIASYRKGNLCYYSTAARLGLRYHFIPHFRGKDARFEIDEGLLVRHVAAALTALV